MAAKLSEKDEQLLRLFLSICCHKWQDLHVYSQQSLDRGATKAELLGCVRHICVVAGYPPALAAAKKLHAAGFLQAGVAGKAGGAPGNAFALVYGSKTIKVYENLYKVEPVLSEWIRLHCYGDIYSSPGLSLRQKQLMISGFLAEAEMHDEFFGHCIAGFRFGGTLPQIVGAVDIAFEVAGSREAKQGVYVHAIRLAQKAARKVAQDFPEGVPPEPEVEIPDQDSLRIPEAPKEPTVPYY